MKDHESEKFWSKRKEYKKTCRRKRVAFEEAELQSRIEDAEVDPWHLFRAKKTRTISPVEIDSWESHFSRLLNPEKKAPACVLPSSQDQDENDDSLWYNTPVTEDEAMEGIARLKDKKAPGLDRIYNEHIKVSANSLGWLWTLLLNTCLYLGIIAAEWRISTLITLYKGKGSVKEPGNYRGIALLCTVFKLLTWILNRRVMASVRRKLPPEQFGFIPMKGTRDAIAKLLAFLKSCGLPEKGKAYCLFVDYEKAFDSIDRDILLGKLYKQFDVKGRILRMIASILKENWICVSDGLRTTARIRQNRGVLQGDSLSPTLFICYIADLSTSLRTVQGLDFSFYADDLVLYSEDLKPIQRGVDILEAWCQANKMKVNTRKTKAMKFRRAGRMSSTDELWYGEEKLEFTNSYDYLGLTLQPSLTFTNHILHRKAKAIAAIGSLSSNLRRVSIPTAMRIFDGKIKPIATYGFDSIHSCLTLQHLKDLDKVKSAFLKATLGVHRSASSTLVHHMTGEETLCSGLRRQIPFSESLDNSYSAFRREREDDFVRKDFLRGPAFTTDIWKKQNRRDRHVTTRTTCHGFHHKICVKDRHIEFNQPDEDCLCKYCDEPASDRYHILTCQRSPPLTFLAKK